MPVALAYLFYDDVERAFTVTVTIALLVIEVYALVHCLAQRADAFTAADTLSKNAWTGILLGSVLVTAICGLWLRQTISIFAFAAITAAAIYLLDVRPGLRDATNGSGGW
jgi:hypothetical protein